MTKVVEKPVEKIVEKVVRAGGTSVVTVSLPTSMAVERARQAGLSLYCLARDDSYLDLQTGCPNN